MAHINSSEQYSSDRFSLELYKSKEGKLLFRKSFCSYIDILGFSKKIESNNLDYFNKYLNTLKTELLFIENVHDFSDSAGLKSFELKIFTDNFIFGHPWFDQFGESELENVYLVLSHLQLTFIKSDIFVRGAISVSDLYMDENIVLGPALIESHNLESKDAIYPRIILSKKVVEIINQQMNYYSKHSSSPQSNKYLIDIDGVHFVNYLFFLFYFEDSPVGLNIDVIAKDLVDHKNAILYNLNLHKHDYKVFDKYCWSARYHNFFCDNFFHPRFPETDLTTIKIDDNSFVKFIQKIV